MKNFLARYKHLVLGAISGWDRLRFRGTIQTLAYPGGLASFLQRSRVLLKDFGDFAESCTKRIRERSEHIALQADRPIQYLQSGATKKEEVARKIAEKDGITKGLVCVLTCVEPCQSFEIFRNNKSKLLELRPRRRQCLHHYHYFIDPTFGWTSIRVQTWFPFSIYICVNGREWLSRQMDSARIEYLRKDNCFPWISDVPRAQKLFDKQLDVDWPKHLDRLLHKAHPLHATLFAEHAGDYYWSLAESEWATDILFESPKDLAGMYPQLIRHAMTVFGSEDVMRFLGHRVPAKGGVHGRFAGQVVTDLARRPEGVRIKHRVNRNAIKMYDKQGTVLRVETTINDPGQMKAHRRKQNDPHGKKEWRPMRKGVADSKRRAQLSQRANERYLEALSAANNSEPLGDTVAKLCQPRMHKGKQVRGMNPFAKEDRSLLRAIFRGEHAISGFRNRDLRPLLFGDKEVSKAETKKQAAVVTRKLRMLRAHGLIKKVSHTHRYRLTVRGLIYITAILAACSTSTETLLENAA